MAASNIGLVAFLDILGYEAFLSHNKDEDQSSKVLEFIDTLHDVKTQDYDGKFLKSMEVEAEFETAIFSDTIIVAVPVPASSSQRDIEPFATMLSFFTRISLLSRRMSAFGLPIRGGIAFGDYKIFRNSFTGSALVEAYNLSKQLDLAGMLVSPDAVDQFKERRKVIGMEGDSGILVKYFAPTKAGRAWHYLLNTFHWSDHGSAFLDADDKALLASDPRQWVVESFWKHQKGMIAEAETKALNTELFVRYCKFVAPALFR